MVPRENKNNGYAKFWRTNKEYYGIFESGLSYGQQNFEHFATSLIFVSGVFRPNRRIVVEFSKN